MEIIQNILGVAGLGFIFAFIILVGFVLDNEE